MVTKIVLNEEQTRKFLSFFIPEALQIAKDRREQQEIEEQLISETELVTSGS